MIIEIKNKDILWTYLSRFFRIGQGLILLPLILKQLPVEQISIWSIYSSVLAFIVVFDLGFTNVFSRNATRLFTESASNYIELYKLLSFMKQFYRTITGLLAVLFSVFGTIYILNITQGLEDRGIVLLSWFFLISSSLLNLYYNYIVILLQSKGLINETQKVVVVGILLYLLLAFVGVVSGGGLLALTASNFISVVYNRVSYIRLFKKEIAKMESNIEEIYQPIAFIDYLKNIWKTTYKVSLSSITSIINYRFGIFALSIYASLESAGSFAFTMNFVFLISEVSFMYYYSHLPQINSQAHANKGSELLVLFKKSIFLSLISFIVMGAVFIFAGNFLLHFIGSNMMLIDSQYIVLALLILFLDQIMCMSTNLLFAFNNLSYVWPQVISSLLITIVTFVLCKYNKDYYSVLLPLLFVQLLFNFWKWPLSIIQILKSKIIVD